MSTAMFTVIAREYYRIVNKIEKCVQSTPNFAQVVQFHKVRGSLPRGLHVSD